MINSSITALLTACLLWSSAQAQLVRRDSKLRFGFGVSKFTSDQVNILIDEIEQTTSAGGLRLPLSRFNDHPIFYLEYEKMLWDDYYYALSLHYGSEAVDGNRDDKPNQVEQALEYEFKLIEFSVSLLRNFSIYNLQKGTINLVTGAGGEMFYGTADMSYIYSQYPLQLQKIEFFRSGFIFGFRLFAGIEAPVISSILLQLRVGYSWLPEKGLSGNVKSSNLETESGANEPVDPGAFITNNRYNFTQLWITFGLAYFF